MNDAELLNTLKEEGVYAPEKCIAVCDLMTTGLSMREAAKKVGIDPGNFVKRVSRSQTLEQQYARARKILIDVRVDRMLEPPNKDDFLDATGRVDNGAVQLYKAFIENEKWVFSKLDSKRFGDRVDHNINANERIITRIEHVIVPAPTERAALPNDNGVIDAETT